ncbi:hypothetical protein T4B_6373 [Trichinella pseudospiralis]|uniref:Uncharacterized protein n=1 Tax=Trichinella pseudospiralis TaxID=6337 RepID=A0A0V1JNB5_TRIPS|nr:hypothetical protein T4B_6373 [Trichinella pseudospiralis]KRZ36399.1 hypothetical protein T4C_7590 [Trichinella pseudospiralis]
MHDVPDELFQFKSQRLYIMHENRESISAKNSSREASSGVVIGSSIVDRFDEINQPLNFFFRVFTADCQFYASK